MKKKMIFHISLLVLVILFSVYEITTLSIDLANYSLEMENSFGAIVSGIVLFSVVILIAVGTIVYIYINKKRKELYRLKK